VEAWKCETVEAWKLGNVKQWKLRNVEIPLGLISYSLL